MRELTITERSAAGSLCTARFHDGDTSCAQCRADIVRLVDAPATGDSGRAALLNQCADICEDIRQTILNNPADPSWTEHLAMASSRILALAVTPPTAGASVSAEDARDVSEAYAALAPCGTRFLDPPDGGSVTLGEQIARLVAEWKALSNQHNGRTDLQLAADFRVAAGRVCRKIADCAPSMLEHAKQSGSIGAGGYVIGYETAAKRCADAVEQMFLQVRPTAAPSVSAVTQEDINWLIDVGSDDLWCKYGDAQPHIKRILAALEAQREGK